MSVSKPLSNKVINLFSLGLSPFMILMGPVGAYFPYFLTDIVKVGAATVGGILLLTRIADAVSIVLVGGVISKTNLKWGKYCSWIYIGAPLTLVFISLLFTNPTFLSMSAKTIYYCVAYILGSFALNFAWSGASSITPNMAVDPKSRVLLSARRMQFSTVARLFYSASHMSIILYFGRTNEGAGYFAFIVMAGFLQLFGYLLAASLAKPYDIKKAVPGSTPSLGDMWKQVAGNPPLLVLMLYGVCNGTILSIAGGLNVYYFKYVANNMLLISVFLTASSIVGMVATVAGQFVAQKIESKRTVMMIGAVISLISYIAAYFFARNTILYMACRWLGAFAGLAGVVNFANYSDVADYAEWKSGKNAKGLVMSISALPMKIASAVAGAITGFGLAAIGYSAAAAATPQLIKGIILLSTLLPAVCAMLGIIILTFYKLDNKTMAKIHEELAARKATA
ncbi:MAG TPA: glycoside-pentoside-hexuronide (GPH):cation symporter [Oscillospiraceae bacterium]|nr:glycoside-pentoside-hexuronide (GPH):cation symporter [Oscillospiraceae bacterium]